MVCSASIAALSFGVGIGGKTALDPYRSPEVSLGCVAGAPSGALNGQLWPDLRLPTVGATSPRLRLRQIHVFPRGFVAVTSRVAAHGPPHQTRHPSDRREI